MKVGIVFAEPTKQVWLNINVEDGATVEDAIKQSGILNKCPEINLEENKVGIYGRFTKLQAKLADGDRIEIYRKITCDPETVPRRDRDEDED